MVRKFASRVAAAVVVLAASAAASAEPIALKFAYFSSDRVSTYRTAIKPFVDAVNDDPSGLVRIEVALSGALGRNPAEQAQLVLDGTADMAFVVPGYRPDLFPDDAVLQLPGLYDNMAEATDVYLKLVAADALRGYDRFHVIGVFTGDPAVFNMRTPVDAIGDLAGKRIRVNNPIEGAAVEKLGAVPVELPITKTAPALGAGEIDGALLPLSEPLVEFGVARMAANHYRLGVSAAPLALLMNRAVFEGLPEPARQLIARHSGAWLAGRIVAGMGAGSEQVVAQLQENPQRRLVMPSAADLDRARAAFAAVIDEWKAADPRNAELFAKAEAALAKNQ